MNHDETQMAQETSDRITHKPTCLSSSLAKYLTYLDSNNIIDRTVFPMR